MGALSDTTNAPSPYVSPNTTISRVDRVVNSASTVLPARDPLGPGHLDLRGRYRIKISLGRLMFYLFLLSATDTSAKPLRSNKQAQHSKETTQRCIKERGREGPALTASGSLKCLVHHA